MSKLIQELAEQAAGNFTQNFKWEHLQQIDKDIFEKFAELVVRECAQKCLDVKRWELREEIEEQCANSIWQHFGVKE
jgi:hypothetical protein